jgi:hypothetical protein
METGASSEAKYSGAGEQKPVGAGVVASALLATLGFVEVAGPWF